MTQLAWSKIFKSVKEYSNVFDTHKICQNYNQRKFQKFDSVNNIANGVCHISRQNG